MNWIPDLKASMITDDIAFIGGAPVSVHCLIGEDGLILIDTGFPYMLRGILQNMSSLGLDPARIRYIIHSHGHIDHYGCSADLRDLSGAEMLIGEEDVPIVTGEKDLSWAKELSLPHARTFTPDLTFRDGDVLTLCGRRIRFVHAPGHTEGTYAIFVDTAVSGVPMTAAMHGGIGLNSMTDEFLDAYGLPRDTRDRFRDGLHRLRGEHVDIVLGNHPEQAGYAEKLDRLSTGRRDAFVDPGEWPLFLFRCEKALDGIDRK